MATDLEQTASEQPNENIRDLFIEKEMKDSYLNYAMSVIVSRALPDVRDGLKPSQRRILIAMRDLNLTPGRSHRKCAKIVGETMGNYHPHGDQAIYPTLVRMAQSFNSRYPLVDPQGNFGSLDGDPPAAMRYTEARMTSISYQMMQDLKKDTVDFQPNFDESREEPVVLPSKIPNLLCNGASGIAVGMATSIPPHNLGEVCDALLLMLEDPEATVEDIMEVLPGPDFPTGGEIKGRNGIYEAYSTGRGKLKLRGVVKEESEEKRLIIEEIPYGVSKKKILEEIADCVKNDKIEGIRDLRDETDRDGIRIVIELKRGWNPQLIVNQLFQYTKLEKTVSLIFLALVDQQPKVLTIQDLLREFLDHRRNIVRRRTEYQLQKAEKQVHRLEGLVIAVDNLDRVISLIRGAESTDEARAGLRSEFDLTKRQAKAILRMQLRRLTGLEREKLRTELSDLRDDIREYKDILEQPGRIDEIIQSELKKVKKQHGDERKTTFGPPVEGFDMEDLIVEEDVAVIMSEDGYCKRMNLELFSRQHRGGVGIIAGNTKDDDEVEHIHVASTHDYFLLFTDQGQVYWQKIYGFPELSRNARGRALVNVIQINRNERVTDFISVPSLNLDKQLFMVTENGYVKKTAFEQYSRPQRGGIRAIRLEDDDRVAGTTLTEGDDEVMLATGNGLAIRFHEDDVRSMGRVTRGVKGIDLQDRDKVVGASRYEENHSFLTISQNGYGKRTNPEEYRVQTRGGKGVINIKTGNRNGPVSDVKMVQDDDDIMICSQRGMAVRVPVEEVPVLGRNTAGVKMMELKENDQVKSLTRLPQPSEGDEETEEQNEE